MPTLGLGIVTCLDPRVDPASFLGLRLSEAMVLRNAGGRVTDRVIADLSFTTFMAQTMAAGAGIEIAVVHHTQCGTGFLADEAFPGVLRRPLGLRRRTTWPPRPSPTRSRRCSTTPSCC